MPDYDELINNSAAVERQELAREKVKPKSFKDFFSLAITTFGVGYIPLAPGTWGSAVGVLIYGLFSQIELNSISYFTSRGWQEAQISAWFYGINSFLLLAFCLLGIWAANRAARIFANKDPQKVVVDEVMGQLITFLFIPFGVHWFYILAGFILFRFFDITKPYPIDSLQNLPAGVGICADDILAGIYAGICLAMVYAVGISF